MYERTDFVLCVCVLQPGAYGGVALLSPPNIQISTELYRLAMTSSHINGCITVCGEL